MAKNRIGQAVRRNIYIGKEQDAMLDATARLNQTSVSDIIRRALKHYFSLLSNATPSSDTRDVA